MTRKEAGSNLEDSGNWDQDKWMELRKTLELEAIRLSEGLCSQKKKKNHVCPDFSFLELQGVFQGFSRILLS